jgi:hypothetical protein
LFILYYCSHISFWFLLLFFVNGRSPHMVLCMNYHANNFMSQELKLVLKYESRNLDTLHNRLWHIYRWKAKVGVSIWPLLALKKDSLGILHIPFNSPWNSIPEYTIRLYLTFLKWKIIRIKWRPLHDQIPQLSILSSCLRSIFWM